MNNETRKKGAMVAIVKTYMAEKKRKERNVVRNAVCRVSERGQIGAARVRMRRMRATANAEAKRTGQRAHTLAVLHVCVRVHRPRRACRLTARKGKWSMQCKAQRAWKLKFKYCMLWVWVVDE